MSTLLARAHCPVREGRPVPDVHQIGQRRTIREVPPPARHLLHGVRARASQGLTIARGQSGSSGSSHHVFQAYKRGSSGNEQRCPLASLIGRLALVIESPEETVLMPADRYAKMRNVWFIPSVPMLEKWLARAGFYRIQHMDTTPTTSVEQRKTEWMTYESLEDFLDPQDASATVEGYPAPRRAVVMAWKREPPKD